MIFSKKLVDKTKEYIYKRTGNQITDEEAEIYLNRFGVLGQSIYDALNKYSSNSDSQSVLSLDLNPSSPLPQGSRKKTTGLVPVVKNSALEQGVGGTRSVAQCPQSAIGIDGIDKS